MPDKLLESSSSCPGILEMQRTDREKRKTVNVTWLCCAIALIALVLAGFAFLLRNFIGHWPNASFLGSSKNTLADDDLPIYPYLGNGHTYDTSIPGQNNNDQVNRRIGSGAEKEQEIIATPPVSNNGDRNRDVLFSENAQVKLEFVRRSQWGAHAAKRKFFLKTFAIERVIVLETATENCFNEVRIEIVSRGEQVTMMMIIITMLSTV